MGNCLRKRPSAETVEPVSFTSAQQPLLLHSPMSDDATNYHTPIQPSDRSAVATTTRHGAQAEEARLLSPPWLELAEPEPLSVERREDELEQQQQELLQQQQAHPPPPPFHTEWFDDLKRQRGMKQISKRKRHDSYVGHAMLCYLLFEQLGLNFVQHEVKEHFRAWQSPYNPDLQFSWKPAKNTEPITVYCEVKCVDSKRQDEDNYDAVQEQCRAGMRKKALQPRIAHNRLLFVGVVVKDGNTLEFACCFGTHHAKFEKLVEGKVKQTHNYCSGSEV